MTNEQQMKLAIWQELMRRQLPNHSGLGGYPTQYAFDPTTAAKKAVEVYQELASKKEAKP